MRFFVLFYFIIFSINGVSQEIPMKLRSYSDERLFEERIFDIKFEQKNGVGIRYYDATSRSWIQNDIEVIPSLTLPFLTSTASFETSFLHEVFEDLDGSFDEAENWLIWEKENHLADNRDFYRILMHKNDWRSALVGVGDSVWADFKSFENQLLMLVDNGYAGRMKECGYGNGQECKSYMVNLSQDLTVVFDLVQGPDVAGFEHAVDRFPKTFRIHTDVYRFNGEIVKRFSNTIPFVVENDEILCSASFESCQDIPMIFDTGATITLLNEQHFTCLENSGNLQFTGDVVQVQTADGSLLSLKNYIYSGEAKLGHFKIQPFEVVFLRDASNLIGKSIWGQLQEFSIDSEKNQITFRR